MCVKLTGGARERGVVHEMYVCVRAQEGKDTPLVRCGFAGAEHRPKRAKASSVRVAEKRGVWRMSEEPAHDPNKKPCQNLYPGVLHRRRDYSP